MKKLKKNDLSLDKEVITSLSGDNLDSLRGGIITYSVPAFTKDCPPYESGAVTKCQCPTDVASCYPISKCDFGDCNSLPTL